MMRRMLVQSAAEDVSKAIIRLAREAPRAPDVAADWVPFLIDQLQHVT